MLSALLLAAFAADAPPPEPPPTVDVRVWPTEPVTTPAALVERFPGPDPALGVHAGVNRFDLDGCWRQQAALGADLDLWFCADLKIDKKGRTKVKIGHLSDPRPGLEACLKATLSAWQGPPDQPVRARMCRVVQTHISDSAREAWKTDAWADVAAPGAPGDPDVAPEHKVGRPKVEGAKKFENDPQTGDLVRIDHPVHLRDRAATTARRLVAAQIPSLERCFADRAGFRVPVPENDDAGAILAYTLDVVVGPSGPVHVAAGAAMPATHLDVAQCAAAALDPELPASEGDLVIEIPVLVGPLVD